jgi:DNA-binding NarL/FixJ family response regulator
VRVATHSEQLEPIRIALADDQSLVRHGLRALLEEECDFEVVVEASDGEELLEALGHTDVDVVLCDIRMPKLTGYGVVQRLRRGANRLPVILVTTFNDPGALKKAVEAGANGYLLKDAEPYELADVIKQVFNGQTILIPQPTARARARLSSSSDNAIHERLGPNELAVLRLMAAGLSNSEIAARLHFAEGTVKNKVSTILAKLRARDRTQAVLKAITERLI